ncbi:hypothetical protein JHN57_35155, partial [Streptomyces sp. MBT59]|nr:hypothetical protein [Streptomyces sp. MBT59]
MIRPDAQLQAGHLPADLYNQLPAGTDARSVVIVQAAPKSHPGPEPAVAARTTAIGPAYDFGAAWTMTTDRAS